MKTSSAVTFYFNEIFPDYASWKEVISQLDIVDYSDPLQSKFDEFCFKILSRHFTHTNIRYSTIDDFISELAVVYENKFNLYQKQKQLIDKMYKLSEEEFEVVNQQINNLANNPNDEPDDPLKPLTFISSQTFSQVKGNKLEAYLNALNKLPTFNIYKFFKADDNDSLGFEDLFMQIIPNIEFLYRKEGD